MYVVYKNHYLSGRQPSFITKKKKIIISFSAIYIAIREQVYYDAF